MVSDETIPSVVFYSALLYLSVAITLPIRDKPLFFSQSTWLGLTFFEAGSVITYGSRFQSELSPHIFILGLVTLAGWFVAWCISMGSSEPNDVQKSSEKPVSKDTT